MEGVKFVEVLIEEGIASVVVRHFDYRKKIAQCAHWDVFYNVCSYKPKLQLALQVCNHMAVQKTNGVLSQKKKRNGVG
jgi:hypothetical protein